MAYLDEQGNIQYLDEQGNSSQTSASSVNPVSDEDLRDLYVNAKKFGVSGLSRGQQELFVQQFPYSQAAKSGMSLADAIKVTDYDASRFPTAGDIFHGLKRTVTDIPGEIGEAAHEFAAAPISSIYGAARDVISAPVAGVAGVGSFLKNTVGDMIDGTPVDLSNNWKNAARYARGVRDEAMAGEGLPGVAADPVTYVPLGEAAGVARGLAKVGLKGTSKFITSSWVPRALVGGAVGAVENAGLTLADNALNPEHDESAVKNGVIGGTMGVISDALPASHFVKELPGITTLTNRAGTPEERQKILDAATDMYNNSTLLGIPGLGGGKASYQRLADKSSEASSKLYDDLARSVSEPGEFWPGGIRNATNVSGEPVAPHTFTIMNSRQVTLPSIPTEDMKSGMLESLNKQNKADKAGFTRAQLSKAVDSYLDRVKAVVPEVGPRDDMRADQYVAPKEIFDSKTWLNSDIYNARSEPGAGDKAKLADMLHTAVNERIGKMTDASGQIQKDLSSKAGKAYADYKLKQRIVDQGVRSASGRYGNSFWAPTARGKAIGLGTQLGASLSR